MHQYKIELNATTEDSWTPEELSTFIKTMLSDGHIQSNYVFVEEYESNMSKELKLFIGESLQYLLVWCQRNLYSFSVMFYDSENDFENGKTDGCLSLRAFLKTFEPNHYKFINFEEDEAILEVIRLA